MQVILVGLDFGGTSISYAMELFPSKISKAVYVAAAMLTNGQSTLDLFNQKTGSSDLMGQAQIFLYANGNDHPPTAIDLDRSLLKKDLLFNQSPAKACFKISRAEITKIISEVGDKDQLFGLRMHSYFSKPQALHKLLVEISKIPAA